MTLGARPLGSAPLASNEAAAAVASFTPSGTIARIPPSAGYAGAPFAHVLRRSAVPVFQFIALTVPANALRRIDADRSYPRAPYFDVLQQPVSPLFQPPDPVYQFAGAVVARPPQDDRSYPRPPYSDVLQTPIAPVLVGPQTPVSPTVVARPSDDRSYPRAPFVENLQPSVAPVFAPPDPIALLPASAPQFGAAYLRTYTAPVVAAQFAPAPVVGNVPPVQLARIAPPADYHRAPYADALSVSVAPLFAPPDPPYQFSGVSIAFTSAHVREVQRGRFEVPRSSIASPSQVAPSPVVSLWTRDPARVTFARLPFTPQPTSNPPGAPAIPAAALRRDSVPFAFSRTTVLPSPVAASVPPFGGITRVDVRERASYILPSGSNTALFPGGAPVVATLIGDMRVSALGRVWTVNTEGRSWRVSSGGRSWIVNAEGRTWLASARGRLWKVTT